MSIYTRTGDTGTTSLFGGKRVLKCAELVDVYGSIDELNSWVGLIASQITVPDVQQFLAMIQSDLFTIGSLLAGWKPASQEVLLRKMEGRVKEMEARIDALEKDLPAIKNFILPGGSVLGSYAHVTRSICRRVERQTVALAQKQPVNPFIIKYLNRLSDLFFMLARFINKKTNQPEIIWSGMKKGK
ncbi:cob(I)yrinic acid a,c-diamide adenosyltransferase [Candidatus Gottesmanbacteria bacterium]|nr:cob(I)yrinic acid a,c-diamide adenosyltransferase [Candidatus Gottesmanbacteria bacterium]